MSVVRMDDPSRKGRCSVTLRVHVPLHRRNVACTIGRVAAEDRQRTVLELARTQGGVDVKNLADRLGVSVETIRRDLNALEAHGLIRRSYGHAYPVETAAFETDLGSREVAHLDEKRRIAEEAVRHIDDAETMYIDEGFTPQLIARNLPSRPITVITPSLPIATVVADRAEATVYLLGGRVRGRTLGTVDHWATDMLGRFVIDLAFVGANAISRTHGLTTPDPAVADVKATAIRVSRRRIFIGVSPKFASSSFCKFAEISDFELIITDRRLSGTEAERIAALGPRVLRV
jgi:DeoR family transcriptional regulator, fructose operon transcriptional repressor